MKNKKGQALVEFVLILPIIIIIFFVIIDLANVFYNKNKLESSTDTVVSYIKEDNKKLDNFLEEENITYEVIKQDEHEETIVVKKSITLSTPFSNIFFKNPYTIKTKRVILYG